MLASTDLAACSRRSRPAAAAAAERARSARLLEGCAPSKQGVRGSGRYKLRPAVSCWRGTAGCRQPLQVASGQRLWIRTCRKSSTDQCSHLHTTTECKARTRTGMVSCRPGRTLASARALLQPPSPPLTS